MTRLLRAAAALVPTFIFLWIGQMAPDLKQLAAAAFVITSSLLAIVFWRQRRQENSEAIKTSGNAVTKVLSGYIAGLILLLMIIITCTFFPVGGYLARPLVLEHSAENAEAIFVLASGATETGDPQLSGLQRINHGIKLLKENRAKHLYISTGFSPGNGNMEAPWVASYTQLIGLDPASFSILNSPEITTTATEAQYAHKKLAEKRINRILLVTSGAHIYRSKATFSKAGFEVLPAPAHNRDNIFYASENYLTSLHAAVHEWIGLVYYWLRDRI
ncbi:MAG: YdcF family protein [Candidatus Riflebacteria bacterium]|nr:YdcF family protein [Candidatus Riflebacteria bacterium]